MAPRRQWLLIILSSLMGLGAMFGFMIARLQPDLRGDPPSAAAPFGSIAEQIRAHGFDKGYIIADRSYIVGNLKLYFPESAVAEPNTGFGRCRPAVRRRPRSSLGKRPRRAGATSVGRLLRALCGPMVSGEIKSFPASRLYEHSETMRFRINAAVVSTCPAGPG